MPSRLRPRRRIFRLYAATMLAYCSGEEQDLCLKTKMNSLRARLVGGTKGDKSPYHPLSPVWYPCQKPIRAREISFGLPLFTVSPYISLSPLPMFLLHDGIVFGPIPT